MPSQALRPSLETPQRESLEVPALLASVAATSSNGGFEDRNEKWEGYSLSTVPVPVPCVAVYGLRPPFPVSYVPARPACATSARMQRGPRLGTIALAYLFRASFQN